MIIVVGDVMLDVKMLALIVLFVGDFVQFSAFWGILSVVHQKKKNPSALVGTYILYGG